VKHHFFSHAAVRITGCCDRADNRQLGSRTRDLQRIYLRELSFARVAANADHCPGAECGNPEFFQIARVAQRVADRDRPGRRGHRHERLCRLCCQRRSAAIWLPTWPACRAAPALTYAPSGGAVFPATVAGATSCAVVTITNTGTANLVFAVNNAVSIASGGNAADFRITSSNCPGVTLQPNQGNCTINVTFPARGRGGDDEDRVTGPHAQCRELHRADERRGRHQFSHYAAGWQRWFDDTAGQRWVDCSVQRFEPGSIGEFCECTVERWRRFVAARCADAARCCDHQASRLSLASRGTLPR
jgi:hypothetical protein